MTEKIGKCAYCGSDCVDVANVLGKFFVKCDDCGANGPEAHGYSDAILLWNAAYNQVEALRKERDGLEESCERLKELIDTCNSMWNNTIQERNEMARDYDNERNRANKLESEVEPLRYELTGRKLENVTLKDERDEAKAEIEKWKAEYVRIRQECDAFYRTNEEVFNENRKLNDEIKKLNVAWQTSEFGCTNLRAERDEANAEIARLVSACDDLEGEYLRMKEHSENLMLRINQLEEYRRTWYKRAMESLDQRDEARRVARRLYADNQLKDGDIIRLCEELDKRPILKIARQIETTEQETP